VILVVDVGGSRMKWGLSGPRGWLAQGAVPNAEIGTLALRDWQSLPRPMRALGVNSAGEAQRVRVEGQLARWKLNIMWLAPTAQAGGVTNSYTRPQELPADRWAAMIAARRRAVATELFPPPCVVVSAGTLISIDALDADGVFRGGLIVPGLRLMLDALAAASPALRVPTGRWHSFPTSNADAAASGALEAACGAIEQMRARLAREDVAVRCYLGGGAAHEIAPRLAGPVEVVDNLVLEGVLALAGETGTG
jgi:type III pantothenate kinase